MKSYPNIIFRKQPDMYTCYPTCASILTGIPVENLLEILGYDESRKKGFTYDEMALALLTLGWSLTCFSIFEFDSLIKNLSSENIFYRTIISIGKQEHYHAVAWDGKSKFVIDPLIENKTVLLKKIKKKISSIEILTPIEKMEMVYFDSLEFKKI